MDWSVQAKITLEGSGRTDDSQLAQLRERLGRAQFVRDDSQLEQLPAPIVEKLLGIEAWVGQITVGGDRKPTLVFVHTLGRYVFVRLVAGLEYEPEDGSLRGRTVRQLRRLIRRLRTESYVVQVFMEARKYFRDLVSTEQERARQSLPVWTDHATVAGVAGRKAKRRDTKGGQD